MVYVNKNLDLLFLHLFQICGWWQDNQLLASARVTVNIWSLFKMFVKLEIQKLWFFFHRKRTEYARERAKKRIVSVVLGCPSGRRVRGSSRRPDAASSLVQNYLRNKQQYKLYQKPIHYFAIIPVPFRNRYLFFPIF